MAAVVAGLVVVGLAVVQGGRVSRQVPGPVGLVPDLTEPRTELWDVQADMLAGQIGDVVVVGNGAQTMGLDADTGEQRWSSFKLGSCWLTDGSHPSGLGYGQQATPVTESRFMVCSDPSGGLVSVDPESGAVTATLVRTDDTAMLISVDDLLLELDLQQPRSVTAVSMTDGASLWSHEINAPVYRWYVAGDWLVLPGPDGVVALDLHTGEQDTGEGPWVTDSAPIYGGGQVRTQIETDGTLHTVGLTSAGTQVWSAEGQLLTPEAGNPTTADTAWVSTPSGALAALSTETGQQRWQRPADSFGAAAVDGVLVLQAPTPEGGVVLVAVDAATGEQLWSAPLGAWLWAPSVLCDGTHVGTVEPGNGEQTLTVRDLHTGEVVTSWSLPGSGSSLALPLPGGRIAQVTGVPDHDPSLDPPPGSFPDVAPHVIVLGR